MDFDPEALSWFKAGMFEPSTGDLEPGEERWVGGGSREASIGGSATSAEW